MKTYHGYGGGVNFVYLKQQSDIHVCNHDSVFEFNSSVLQTWFRNKGNTFGLYFRVNSTVP